jgi:arabinogalactan endo-1,4-beta-galactosidase
MTYKLFIKPAPLMVLFFLLVFQHQDVRAQFANGADIGWLSQMEAQGFVFKDSNRVEKGCMEILKGIGINALRFRVWVNPSGGYCNKKDVAYMAQRAHNLGFKVLIDFHYSDTWADPGNQAKPAAWTNDNITQLDSDVYHHTYNVLDTLKSLGVIPDWVQIGNETNNGMLWEEGRASTHMDNFASLIKSGYAAVKAIDTSIQVIVHLSNAHDNSMYRWMFDGLKNYGAKWDIIGMSVYPYWANLSWQADDSLALINMKDMISRYNTKVMVVETGYLFNQPVTANHFLIDLITKTKSVGGLGVFYWEPEANPQKYPSSGYNLGAWDPNTFEPTVAMDAFLGNYVTSVSDQHPIVSENYSLYQNYPNPFNPSTTIKYSISKSTLVNLTIYNMVGEQVKVLLKGRQAEGGHSIIWDGTNNSGTRVSSGIYFILLRAGGQNLLRKMVLLK